MALSERTIVDRLEVLADGSVQVREANQILRDGAVVSQSYHRRVVSILDANPDLSWLDDASRAVVQAARTPERLSEAQQRLAAMMAAENAADASADAPEPAGETVEPNPALLPEGYDPANPVTPEEPAPTDAP